MSPSKRNPASPVKIDLRSLEQSPCRRSTVSPDKEYALFKAVAVELQQPTRHTSPPSRVPALETLSSKRASRRATISPKKQVRIVEPAIQCIKTRRRSASPRKADQYPANKANVEIKIPRSKIEKAQEVKELDDEQRRKTAVLVDTVKLDNTALPAGIESQGSVVIPVTEIDISPLSTTATVDFNDSLPDVRTMDFHANIAEIDDIDAADLEDGVAQYFLTEYADENPEDQGSDGAETICITDAEIPSRSSLRKENDLDIESPNMLANEAENLPRCTEALSGDEEGPLADHMSLLAGEQCVQPTIPAFTGEEKEEPEPSSGAQDIKDQEFITKELDAANAENSPMRSPSLPVIAAKSVQQTLIQDDDSDVKKDMTPLVVVQSPVRTAAVPEVTTRSIARLSDDTTMLKAFLNRAQAKKAAKDVTLPAPERPADALLSPRRSPRKALAERDGNSPSPRMTRDLPHRSGTPPSKERFAQNLDDANQWEDIDELSVAVQDNQPIRRSARGKKLPVPSKSIAPAASAPSWIPVRRVEGTDPVVLQKSVAQELAVLTRANTRRNKGQAKLPIFVLEELQVQVIGEVEQERSVTRSQTKAARKAVGWDEKLVYFQQKAEQAPATQVEDERQPKMRRLRGLGGVNGTPAPKRRPADIPATPPANGRPASKRRGNARL